MDFINAGYNNKITRIRCRNTLVRAIFSYVYCMVQPRWEISWI